ncbi:MAG: asparagine synthase-related protein [Acidobacteriota bacterium]
MAIAGILRFGEPRPVARDLEIMGKGLAPYGGGRLETWSTASIGMVRTTDPRTTRRPPGNGSPGDSSRYVAFADARIDNRAEVAGLLGLPAGEAGTLTDGDFIQRAFEAWGTALTDRIIGAFAFAVWDAGRNRLLCFRDHTGQRPLFYYRSESLFAFASMPTALLALDEIPCRLDEMKMAETLLGCHLRTDFSPFAGIRRLAGGSRLETGPSSQRVSRYWNVADCPPVRHASDADYAAAARSLLQSSTAGKIRSGELIGASLSGGLDSSSVVCAAAAHLQAQQRHITAFHRTPPPDFARLPPRTKLLHETAFVEAIAEQYHNVAVNYIRQGADSLLQGLDERTRFCQRPVLRVANHHWFHPLWSAAGELGVGGLLVGGAGDLTFSWGGQGELAQLARHGRWLALAHLLPQRSDWLGQPKRRVLRSHVVAPLVRELQFRATAPFARRRSIEHAAARSPLRPGLIDELNLEQWLRELGWETGVPRLPQQRSLRVRQANAYDDAVGEIHTGLRAMYGFEFRDPFRDKRVYEFCFGIPPLQYLAGGADRSLLRRAAAGLVPDTILERHKKGAQAVDWAERLVETRDEIRDQIAAISRSPLASHVLDVPRMSSILESDRLASWIAAHDGATRFEPGGAYGSLMRDYGEVLLKGISAGMFLRWLEEGCPPMTHATKWTGE